jgi:protein SCO1
VRYAEVHRETGPRGRTLKFYGDVIKDKIVLISFVHTNCPDICPLATAQIAQVEDKPGH